MAQDYKSAWKNIDQLNQQGKYRSALEETDKIYQLAENEGDVDEQLKALFHRAAYIQRLEEDGFEAMITTLDSAVENSSNETFLAVGHHVLGRAYFAYLQRQRGRGTPTSTEVNPGAPLKEWPLERLVKTGLEHLLLGVELAEKNEVLLDKIPAIVTAGERLEYQKPSLYELLVFETLAALSQYDGYLIEPTFAYRPTADFLFAPAKEFIASVPETRDSSSFIYRTVRIYQRLLSRNIDRKDREPTFVHANLKRLEWAYQQRSQAAEYYEALNRLHRQYKTVEGAGDILFQIATLVYTNKELGAENEQEEDRHLARALVIFQRVASEYPKTATAQSALGFIETIHRPSLRSVTEEILLPGQPILVKVDYQNVERLYYRLVPREFTLEDREEQNVEFKQKIKERLRRKTLEMDQVALRPNDDYAQHGVEFALDAQAAGEYDLIISANATFDIEKSPVLITPLSISQLALIKLNEKTHSTGVALDRNTGAPIAGVKVTFYQYQGNYRNRKLVETGKTVSGQDGRFKMTGPRRNLSILLQKGEDRFLTSYYNSSYRNTPNEYKSEKILTDRGIYRPGQTVQFKAMLLKYDKQGVPTIRPNEKITVTLYDANGQNVGTEELTSDSYGAVHGAFKLPEGGLNGQFRLGTTNGNMNFRVEAYKRPRFEVVFDESDKPVQPGDQVTVTGKAIGFAGPAVSGATVRYKVERQEVSYPWYYFSRRRAPQQSEAVIATGETETDNDGSFSIDFEAIVPANDENRSYFRPGYRFLVSVDVADITGETHSAETNRSVKAQGKNLAIAQPGNLDLARDKELTIDLKYAGEVAEGGLPVTLRIQPVIHPDPALIERKWPVPDRPVLSKGKFKEQFPLLAYGETPDLENWEAQGKLAYSQISRIKGDTSITVNTAGLATGHYRIEASYRVDGEEKTVYERFHTVNSQIGELPSGQLKYYAHNENTKPDVGSTVSTTLVAAVPLPQVYVSWQSRGTDRLFEPNRVDKLTSFSHVIEASDRGQLVFSYNFIRFNRFHTQTENIEVPWKEKELQLSYLTFRDKLRPGEEEKWTVTVKDHAGEPVKSQVLAAMYDASLDQIVGFNWQQHLSLFPTSYYGQAQAQAFRFGQNGGYGVYQPKQKQKQREYLNFQPASLRTGPLNLSGYQNYGLSRMMRSSMAVEETSDATLESKQSAPPPPAPPPPGAPANYSVDMLKEEAEADGAVANVAGAMSADEPAPPVTIRKNLQETAFFQPDLLTDKDGNTLISFTTPEALTRWKLQVFAHTPELAHVYSSKEVVTQKELMILPNAPRFLREGDRIHFTAKVSNLSDKMLNGVASIELFDPETEELISDFKVAGLSPGSKAAEIPVTLADQENKVVTWQIEVPDGSAGLIGYRVIVRAGDYSDGEQNVIPVLTNRVFLTASKPFYVKPGQKKTATLTALAQMNGKGNLQHQGFSFEMTADPSWLVVKSLPYLMEYPYDCTEQIANRFFANQLSYQIVNSNPALKNVFEAWKADVNALRSPLALNEDLKQAALEETPWLREAADEGEQRKRLAVLFDLNRMASELEATLAKLEQRQNSDGTFSWFPGGPENVYMTRYVAETMLRLDELGALTGEFQQRATNMARKTFDFLDFKMRESYERIMEYNKKKKEREDYRPGSDIIHYFYVRNTTVQGKQLNDKEREAYDYFFAQAEKFWTQYGLYEQALLSIVFQRAKSPKGMEIIESLRERAIRKDELGTYWKYPRGYSWQQLPIETHCRLIEAFQRAGAPSTELDDMRLYLLQNKRTNRWETTKATAAAAYAFLHTEGEKLKISGSQEVKVAFPDLDKSVYADHLSAAEQSAEAGTGYYRVQWSGDKVSTDFAKVQLRNKGERIAWGGLYWQFTQDIDAVAANADNPLQLKRKLYRRINTDAGERLEAITADQPMEPGERLVVQLVVTTDRDMEYVHLKDRRASSLEPTEQLSQYRYENGLGFYFSPDDLAVHYFFDYLPRGTYTLEYDLFVNHAGDFSNGLSVIQSMYAPEFSGYSAGSRLVVEKD